MTITPCGISGCNGHATHEELFHGWAPSDDKRSVYTLVRVQMCSEHWLVNGQTDGSSFKLRESGG